MSELRLGRIEHDHLDAVATIHRKAFKGSAITAFGHEAVRRYYRWLLDGPHDAELVGAWQHARLVGFCASGMFRGALSGFLRGNRLYLAGRMLTHPWLAASELVRDRVKEGIKVMVRFSRVVPQAVPEKRFGILAIATDPDAQRGGIGRALMDEAEARARRNGHDRILLSVHPSNKSAIQFYERLGWTRRANAVGTWKGSMEKRLA